MPDPADVFDAIVIGGGSGGLAFARTAAEHGARVALVERGALGGTCVNRGCVPKKLLWQAANWLNTGRQMSEMGLTKAPLFDFERLQERIGRKIATIRDSHQERLTKAGVTLFRGIARAEDADRVRVGDRTLSTRRLIVATGARPSQIGIDGAELTETSDDVFGWTEVPASLIILGGGYIGCEMASIFASFGTDVHLLEPSDRLLSPFDADLARMALGALDRLGVHVHLKTEPALVSATEKGYAVTTRSGPVITAGRVLNATGRTPNIDNLGPLGDHLDAAESGALAVSDRLETNVPGVYALGDAADRLPLTPVATRDGTDLANMLFGENGSLIDLGRIVQAAFLIPPVAQAGQPNAAPTRGTRLSTGVTAPDTGPTTLHKIATAEGAITGLAIAGEHAAELASLGGALLGAPREALTRTEGVHPSFAEELTGH